MLVFGLSFQKSGVLQQPRKLLLETQETKTKESSFVLLQTKEKNSSQFFGLKP